MAGRNCWPMQIYCWVFITIFKKACQVFYNTHFRWLKRISFSFKTPTSPFSPGWLIIRECTFLIMWEEFFKKLKLYGPFLWMGFNCLKVIEPLRGGSLLLPLSSQKSEIPSYEKVFLKPTKLLLSMSSLPSLDGQYFLGFSKFLFPLAAALVAWHKGLRVLKFPEWCNQNDERTTMSFYF